jgi:hypothetical protein
MPFFQTYAQALPTVGWSFLHSTVLQIIADHPVPEFPSIEIGAGNLIAKITRVHVTEWSAILPALMHNFMFCYPTDDQRISTVFVAPLFQHCGFSAAAHGKGIDISISAILAEEDPIHCQ